MKNHLSYYNSFSVSSVRLSVCLCIMNLLPDAWTNRPEIFSGCSQDHRPWFGKNMVSVRVLCSYFKMNFSLQQSHNNITECLVSTQPQWYYIIQIKM